MTDIIWSEVYRKLILKKIIHILLALFLLQQTSRIISKLYSTPVDTLDTGAFWGISFLLAVYITGIFAFPGFSFATHKLLPESYYGIRYKNTLKKAYKVLGVKYFRYLLMVFFWGRKNNRRKYFNGSRNGLTNLIYQSKQSEFGHLGALVIILLLSIALLLHGYNKIFLMINFINIIGNLYPVILQRHHRMRIDRIKSAI